MKKRLKESKTRITNTPIAQNCTGTSLIKHLASSKASIRSKALKHIQEWLLTQPQMGDDDMKKLWKGLFYCLWHSDKAQAQGLLITRICSVVDFLDLDIALRYFSGFLITLRREWNGIDHLRLDKFYLLIRKFLRAVFELLRKKYCWDLEVVGKVNEVIEDYALLPSKEGWLLGHGVSYHIASVFLDELKGCFVPVREDVVVCLFKPFLSVMGRSEDKIMVGKVKSCVFEELLKVGRVLLERRKEGVEGGGNESYGDVAFGVIALKMGFSGKLFEVGSSVDCVQGNRKVVLNLHEEFLRLEKEFEASGIECSLPEMNEEVVDDDDGEEVPQLIPIENNGFTDEAGDLEVAKDENDEGFGDKALRKRKKVKREEDGGSKKAKKKEKKKKVSENDTLVEENGNNELEGSKWGKKKKKKKGLSDNFSTLENISSGDKEESMITMNGDSSNYELVIENKVIFNENMISNLQMQFEKVAAEVASNGDDDNDSSHTPTIPMKKKRKRGKIVEGTESCIPFGSGEGEAGTKSEKSSKKVRFAMKNNLVWKPNSPMPPQDLRLPPTLTPRGSALKKGVPPGPIREMPSSTKKMKQKKKGRKILRTVSPAMKRLKRMKAMST